jgi:3-keto-disaccharide hydrolase
MRATACLLAGGLAVALGLTVSTPQAQGNPPAGFVSIFNGKDLTGWKIPEGDGGHWKVVDGAIDYDASSEAKDKNLWSVKAYKNFELMIDWRIKEVPYISKNMKIVMPDGTNKKDNKGQEINLVAPDSDSGIIPRGHGRAQFNIWNWPVGSGEMYGYRTSKDATPEMRRNATPRMNADKNIGEWNTFHITVVGSSVMLVHNGQNVIPKWTLPDLPPEGPIGLQHHGGPKGPDGNYTGIPALLQYKNIYVKELP